MMPDDRIADIFRDHGQYVTGKERALIRAIAEAVATQRTWVGLTDEEIKKIVGSDRYTALLLEVVQIVETKLKEKNR